MRLYNQIISVSIVVLIIGLAGCKSRKRIGDCSEKQIKLSKDAVDQMANSQLNFNDLSLRIKANYQSGQNSQGFMMHLKMKKDSFVFVSIQVMIEAARAYITTDSFVVLDRIGKKYYQGAIADLSQFTGQELTLSQLQNLIVGNPVYAATLFKIKNDELRNDYLHYNQNGLNNNVQLNGCNKVMDSEFKKVQSTSSANLHYGNFSKVKNLGVMPHLLQFSGVTKGEDVTMTMEYTSVITDPIQPFKFKIPSKYVKAN